MVVVDSAQSKVECDISVDHSIYLTVMPQFWFVLSEFCRPESSTTRSLVYSLVTGACDHGAVAINVSELENL